MRNTDSTVSDNFVKFEGADKIYIFSHLALIKGKIHFSNKINLFIIYAHAPILLVVDMLQDIPRVIFYTIKEGKLSLSFSLLSN